LDRLKARIRGEEGAEFPPVNRQDAIAETTRGAEDHPVYCVDVIVQSHLDRPPLLAINLLLPSAISSLRQVLKQSPQKGTSQDLDQTDLATVLPVVTFLTNDADNP
jgi:hypothetical protein